MELDGVTLEKLKFGVEAQLPEDLWQGMEVETAVDWWMKGILLRLRGWLPAEKLDEKILTFHLDVPTSWWQMFKRDVLKLRKYKRRQWEVPVSFRQYRVYPEAHKYIDLGPMHRHDLYIVGEPEETT